VAAPSGAQAQPESGIALAGLSSGITCSASLDVDCDSLVDATFIQSATHQQHRLNMVVGTQAHRLHQMGYRTRQPCISSNVSRASVRIPSIMK
jgi:hypothetical protein